MHRTLLVAALSSLLISSTQIIYVGSIGAHHQPATGGGNNGLKWVQVSIPHYRKPGETARMQCDYDLGNDTLYAVKWYKENEEFYRYVPKERPQGSSHRVDGVHVDISLSDSRKVVLRSVSLRTSGLYRCEVSAEAPSFASAQGEARMEVVSLPKEDPKITGVQVQYQIGDELHLNCTSGRSYPASILHWYINEQQVTSGRELIDYPAIHHRHGLVTTIQGLRFNIGRRHFLDGSMRVKCVAAVSPVLLLQQQQQQQQHQHHHHQQQQQQQQQHVVVDDHASAVATQDLPVQDQREALLLVKNFGGAPTVTTLRRGELLIFMVFVHIVLMV